MKRFLPGLCLALLLGNLAAAPSARAWWWHRHHNSAAPSEKPKHKEKEHKEKARNSWFHHEKASPSGESAAMTNGPRSIGHWHPMPGPAGAGAR